MDRYRRVTSYFFLDKKVTATSRAGNRPLQGLPLLRACPDSRTVQEIGVLAESGSRFKNVFGVARRNGWKPGNGTNEAGASPD